MVSSDGDARAAIRGWLQENVTGGRDVPNDEPLIEGGVMTSLQTVRSEEHTSELQSRQYLVCRLLLEKKKEIEHTSQSLVTGNTTLVDLREGDCVLVAPTTLTLPECACAPPKLSLFPTHSPRSSSLTS